MWILSVRDNSINSPLLSLPGEIRQKIWDHAIGGMRIHFEFGQRVKYSVYDTADKHDFELEHQFSLPRVCRQIYSKVGANFYRLNVFYFEDYASLNRFRQHMKRAQLEALRTITTSVDVVNRVYPSTLRTAAARVGGMRTRMGEMGRATARDWFLETPIDGMWLSFHAIFHQLQTIIVFGRAISESMKALMVVESKEEPKVLVVFD